MIINKVLAMQSSTGLTLVDSVLISIAVIAVYAILLLVTVSRSNGPDD